MAALDWQGLLRVGLRRLPPDQFWDLTPYELRLVLGLEQPAATMDRNRLSALMRDFPDAVSADATSPT